MTLCKLCGNNEAIKNSHVISKFLWRTSGIIGRHKKFNAVCLSDHSLTERNKQDGFKEAILCTACEGTRSKLEFKAQQSLFHGIRQLDFTHGSITVSGLDYMSTKLFFMWQIWMMGAANHGMYANVELGPHHEHLGKMILTEDAGIPWQYGTTIAVLGGSNLDMAGVFSQPQRTRLFGHNAYGYVIAGLHFYTYVSSNPPETAFQGLFLQSNGEWPLFTGSIGDYPYLHPQF